MTDSVDAAAELQNRLESVAKERRERELAAEESQGAES